MKLGATMGNDVLTRADIRGAWLSEAAFALFASPTSTGRGLSNNSTNTTHATTHNAHMKS